MSLFSCNQCSEGVLAYSDDERVIILQMEVAMEFGYLVDLLIILAVIILCLAVPGLIIYNFISDMWGLDIYDIIKSTFAMILTVGALFLPNLPQRS